VKVTDPAGETWRVRRRILPWRRHRDLPGFPDWAGDLIDVPDDPVSLILVAVILFPVVAVLVIVFGELLLLLLLLPLVLLLRIAFRRPWEIDVLRGDMLVRTERVVGWRAAGERVQSIAAEVARGGSLAP
jgi:hypothetical protein